MTCNDTKILINGLSLQEAQGSLRITLGRFTTESEVNFFIEKLPVVIERLRQISPFA